MKSVGIVVEYNPFHNGHKHHLEMARKVSNADIVIGVMSGDYVQRGEPAAFNRWERAEIALKNGVDIIAELPIFYSTQNAELFAKGALEILAELGVKDIVFGSETANLEKLEKIVEVTQCKEYEEILKEELQKGNAYPKASSTALERLGVEPSSKSNDILGIEYIRSSKKVGINLIPIKRVGAGYHDKGVVEGFSSATGIRQMLSSEDTDIDEIKKVVPEETYNHLLNLLGYLTENPHSENLGKIVKLEDFYPLIRYEIINNCDSLIKIQDVEEGLDLRLYECAKKHDSYLKFKESLSTKRYTAGRVQRVLIHILIGLTKELTSEIKFREKTPYIRVLGFNENGRRYLNHIKKSREEDSPKIITSLSNIRRDLTTEERKFLEFNEKASLIYKMLSNYEDRKIPLMIK